MLICKIGDFVNYNGEKATVKNILSNDLTHGQQLLLQLSFPPNSVGPSTYDILAFADAVTEWVKLEV